MTTPNPSSPFIKAFGSPSVSMHAGRFLILMLASIAIACSKTDGQSSVQAESPSSTLPTGAMQKPAGDCPGPIQCNVESLEIEEPRVDLPDQRILFTRANQCIFYAPGTGMLKTIPVPEQFSRHAMESLSDGIVFAGGDREGSTKENPSSRDDVMLLKDDGSTIYGKLSEARFRPLSVRLDDHSMLVIGGEHRYNSMSSAVDRIEVIKHPLGILTMKVSRLADLPGPPRRGSALAVLKDGRILVAGGDATGFNTGSKSISNVYLFDPANFSWQEVAPMKQARSFFSATPLPDGRVLVVGGWLPNINPNATSRTEIYDPAEDRWEDYSEMPAPSSNHQARWLDVEHKDMLLVGGGSNPQIQALDLNTGHWRTVGELRDMRQGAEIAPYRDAASGQPLVWVSGGLHSPITRFSVSDANVERVPLRIYSRSTIGANFIPLSRVPALANGPEGTFVVGGSMHTNSGAIRTASADYLDTVNNTFESLPTLGHARDHAANAVYLAGKHLLVVGGGDSKPMPLEYYRTDSRDDGWKIVELENDSQSVLEQNSAIASYDNDSLLILSEDGRVARVTFGQLPSAKLEYLPHLLRPRQNALVRRLVDGRIIVAGGRIPVDMIATYDENAKETDETTYQGFGGSVVAQDYEIFDPKTSRWQISTPLPDLLHSVGEDQPIAILDDGRVVALTIVKTPKDSKEDSQENVYFFPLAISIPDGTQWQNLPLPQGLDPAVPFTQNGELFVFSHRADPADYSSSIEGVWWYDSEKKTWQEILAFKGIVLQRYVLFRLQTPNGKRIVWFH